MGKADLNFKFICSFLSHYNIFIPYLSHILYFFIIFYFWIWLWALYKLKSIFLIFFGPNTLNFPYISEELTDKYHLRKSILACSNILSIYLLFFNIYIYQPHNGYYSLRNRILRSSYSLIFNPSLKLLEAKNLEDNNLHKVHEKHFIFPNRIPWKSNKKC
jgi:hypothetical protein